MKIDIYHENSNIFFSGALDYLVSEDHIGPWLIHIQTGYDHLDGKTLPISI